jgi:hypothetical protein
MDQNSPRETLINSTVDHSPKRNPLSLKVLFFGKPI